MQFKKVLWRSVILIQSEYVIINLQSEHSGANCLLYFREHGCLSLVVVYLSQYNGHIYIGMPIFI